MSVSEGLKERRESVDDEVFVSFVDEALENQDVLVREVEEPTLKHGTDTVNYDGVLQEGLVPGGENSSSTGESGDGDDVAFSTSFPVALRYAELTEACRQEEHSGYNIASGDYGSVQDPMVVELPADGVEGLNIDSRNSSAVESLLDSELSDHARAAVLSYIESSEVDEGFVEAYGQGEGLLSEAVRGEEGAEEAVLAVLGDEYADPGVLQEKGVFGQISHDEVNGDFLQEVNAPYADMGESSVVYVPGSELEGYREKASDHGFEGDIHSLEARAIVHEERMKDVYRDQGTVNFTHPGDEGKPVNIFGTDGMEDYDEGPQVVDVSRLRGENLYEDGSGL